MINQIKAIEAINNEVKYEQVILKYFFENQTKIKELIEKENVEIKELKDFIIETTNFFRKEVFVDFDRLLVSIDLNNLNIKNCGTSIDLKKNIEATNTRIRGLKKEIIVKEVDAGHYLNIKSIEFNTKIKDLEEFIKSDFNKIDLLCLIINKLKEKNEITYCEENKKVISTLINELKKRNKELKEILTLINKLENSMIQPFEELIYIKERINESKN